MKILINDSNIQQKSAIKVGNNNNNLNSSALI